jgi:Ricin-type beta-trefoil lectin domain
MIRMISILVVAGVIGAATGVTDAAQLVGSSGSCADIQQGNTADGTPMILFHCHGSPNQNWVISNGTINGTSGVCLDVMGSVARDGAQIIIVQCNGRPSQKWQVLNGQIVGLGGKCLDTQAGSSDDRTPLVLNTCAAGVGGQIWSIQ